MREIKWDCCPLVAQNPITRAFIEHVANEQRAASTIENYSRDLNDFLTAFPVTLFADLLEADERVIDTYIDWLWNRQAQRPLKREAIDGTVIRLPGRLAPATVRRRITTLRGFYSWCIRRHLRQDPINPVRSGSRGKDRGPVPVLTSVPWIPDERQWKSILKHLLGNFSTRDQALVLLVHDGALRRSEVVLVRVDDIDWRTHTINVRPEITKNHMPGTIVLSNPAYMRLKEYIEGDRAALLRAYGGDPVGPIFLSDSQRNPGQPLSKWTVKDIFDRIRDELGIQRLTPHTLRHLMLTELKKSGMDLLDISRYGRHRRVSSTEIYLHTDVSELARDVNKAHERLERLIKEAEGEDGKI